MASWQRPATSNTARAVTKVQLASLLKWRRYLSRLQKWRKQCRNNCNTAPLNQTHRKEVYTATPITVPPPAEVSAPETSEQRSIHQSQPNMTDEMFTQKAAPTRILVASEQHDDRTEARPSLQNQWRGTAIMPSARLWHRPATHIGICLGLELKNLGKRPYCNDTHYRSASHAAN